MAEYSEQVKARGLLTSSLRKMSNPTSKKEVTDSFRHDRVMFGELLFMPTSFLISRLSLISPPHPLHISHTCIYLNIYLRWILEVRLKTSLSLYS